MGRGSCGPVAAVTNESQKQPASQHVEAPLHALSLFDFRCTFDPEFLTAAPRWFSTGGATSKQEPKIQLQFCSDKNKEWPHKQR
jgi:hypothetical protein